MKTQHPTYVMGDVHGHWDEIIEAAPNLSHAFNRIYLNSGW